MTVLQEKSFEISRKIERLDLNIEIIKYQIFNAGTPDEKKSYQEQLAKYEEEWNELQKVCSEIMSKYNSFEN